MNEQTWLTGNNTKLMLDYMEKDSFDVTRKTPSRIGSDRIFILFSTGCIRLHWTELTDISKRAVEIAEGYADGKATIDQKMQASYHLLQTQQLNNVQWSAVCAVCGDTPVNASKIIVREQVGTQEQQCNILRCLVGNPFQSVYLSPIGPKLATQGDNYKIPYAIAQSIYETRNFNEYPVLADALMENGYNYRVCRKCAGKKTQRKETYPFSGPLGVFGAQSVTSVNEECEFCSGTGLEPDSVLDHLLRCETHARGCFVLDTILGL